VGFPALLTRRLHRASGSPRGLDAVSLFRLAGRPVRL
jgi:hypothetical protein